MCHRDHGYARYAIDIRIALLFLTVNILTVNILSDRPWRVDFGFGQVDFCLTCPDGQVEILKEYSSMW